jgi:hypothetical protein
MPRSTTQFSRWQAHDPTSWAFQVFRSYNAELYRIVASHRVVSSFAYSQLKAVGASRDSKCESVFKPDIVDFDRNFPKIENWSIFYNDFDNWANLSTVLTLASNIETYLSLAVSLAIDSDPGLLLGASRSIDGAQVLKYRKQRPAHISSHVTACVKGEWSERLSAFAKLFGECPDQIRRYHSDLEEMRSIRNRFGHAFGRDIERSRQHGVLEIDPMERVKRKRAERLGRTAWSFAREVDRFLLERHIGDFEALYFYHNLFPTLPQNVHASERAVIFKKKIGRFGAGLRGKAYCKELVEYWETL